MLKELIAESFIEARAGAQDRRHRQLHATAKGARLARDLAHLQTRRFLQGDGGASAKAGASGRSRSCWR